MKNRDDRTTIEIQSHMAKAKAALNAGIPFTLDEYCCLVCNAYFTKQIFQSDLEVIEDLIKFFNFSGSLKNVSVLQDILDSTNSLKKISKGFSLKKDFDRILSDDQKNKLRNLYKNKATKDSRVHDMKGEEYDNFYAKYARDLDSNWIRNIERFVALKLTKKSKILDIGCGFGLFSHLAEFNGHKVDSIDIPNASPILKDAAKLLKIKKHEFTIEKNTPLPKFKSKFDVVTANQIFFNGHTTKELWDVEDWKYFLMDIHDNILNEDGSVHLVFNAEHKNLKPIVVNGEVLILGKKSLEEFFKPFFVMVTGMARLDNRLVVILTKRNIKDACQSTIFKKRSYKLEV